MSKSVNLLPHKTVANRKGTVTILYIRFVSILLVFFLFLSALALFFINTVFSPEAEKKQESIILTNFTSVNSRMVKLFLLRDRLKDIQTIISKRISFDKILDEIRFQVPQNVTIDSLKIDRKEVTLFASSSSLSSLNIFLDNFVEMTNRKKLFRSILLKEIGFDGKNKFFLSTKIQFL